MLTRWRERAAHHLMPLFLLNGMGHAKVYTLQSSRRDGACWLATYAAQAPREYQIVVRYPGGTRAHAGHRESPH